MNHGGALATRRVGVAVVGLGNAGQGHIAALGNCPEYQVVAGVEPDTEVARRASIPIRDFTEILQDDATDIVAFCLPPGGRAELVAGALRSGKHVLVEKPPAQDVAELDDLTSTARAAGRFAGVMFQHRLCLPDQLTAMDPSAPAERFAGATGSLVVSRPRGDTYYGHGWRSRAAVAMGGVTAHLGVHYLDLACQVLGPIADAEVLSRIEAAPGVDSELIGHIRFVSGAALNLTVTSRSKHRCEHLTILGPNDRLEIRDGACTGEFAGEAFTHTARPAMELRAEVYRRLAIAVRTGSNLGVIALSRSRTITDALVRLSGVAAIPAGVDRAW
ncbi:Gfo/Idh/MocA family protein [Nocardia abscessus]|uniref:Gfo/Idh/MocA family protein n=1 Tax=Nocardia abscessus TaxID=120957 RepID=UPI0024590B7B|nr:Gfo/Idh/MocA family oxidoreductase [Nocardia abscessus]